MRLSGGCISDIGAGREVNQDAVIFRHMEQNGLYFALGAVCDGVGGLECGEKASQLVIREIEEWFEAISVWMDVEAIEADILYAHLLDGVEEWNTRVRKLSFCENIHTGTTLSLIMIIRKNYYIVQVGDSRIYKYRRRLEQLTTDAVVTGFKNGEMKNYLANYMGKADKLWYSDAKGVFQEGDMFLFCSDGGYHMLTEKDVEEIYINYKEKENLSEVSRRLIKVLIARGECDNVSMGIIMTENVGAGNVKNCSGNEMLQKEQKKQKRKEHDIVQSGQKKIFSKAVFSRFSF